MLLTNRSSACSCILVLYFDTNDLTLILSNDTIIDGKAKITGYCMSFKNLGDIDLSVLQDAIRQALT